MNSAGPCGFVGIDKPTGWTSHDVVARVRRVLPTRRVGHAGTLDPLATGVLVIGVGRATRLLGQISGGDKTYESTFRLGESTTTDDADGETVAVQDAAGVTRTDLDAAIAAFIGDIHQRPSSVSAIKVAGRRAYDRVRSGEEVVLPARPVRISEFEVLDYRPDDAEVDVRVTCSSGTYIRALARDVGEALGVGAHVRTLRRTAIGPFTVADCQTLDSFSVTPAVSAIADMGAAWFPIVTVSDDAAADLSHGRTCPILDVPDAASVLVLNAAGDAICQARVDHGMLHPAVVFAEPHPHSREEVTR